MKIFHTITRFAALIAVVLLCGSGIAMAEWSELPRLPVGQLWGTTTHYAEGKLYVIGGSQGSGQAPSPSSNIYALDPASPAPAWQTVANLPVPLFVHSSTVIDGKIYIFGGLYVTGANLQANLQTYIFDPATNSVTNGPTMPRAVMQAPAVTVGSRAYILGGVTLQNNQQVYTPYILVFDATTNSFEDWTLPNQNTMPYAAYDVQATTIGSSIYLMGGSTGQGFYVTTHKGTVSPSGVTWERLADFPGGIGIGGGAAAAIGDRPLLAGGTLGSAALLYNTTTNTWDTYNSLPAQGDNYPAMTSDGTNAFYVGGMGSNQVFKADDILAPEMQIGRTSFAIAVKKGTQGKLVIPVGNAGSAPLTADFAATGTSWVTSGGEVSIPAGSRGTIRVNLDASTQEVGRISVAGQITSNDPNAPTTPVTIDVWVMEDLIQQPNIAVLEEAHGTWCPPCGEYGVPTVEALMAQYGERLIVLSHHDKGGSRYDPFAITAGETLNQRLGLTSYPTGAVQRWKQNGAFQISAGAPWANAIADVFEESEYAKAAIEVTDYQYNAQTRQVSGNMVITTAAPIAWAGNSSLRATVIITESGYPYMQQFVTQQAKVIEHKHVTRHFWPNIDGQLVALGSDATVDAGAILKPGLSYTVPFSFTVPAATTPTANGDLASVPITPENCKIVFMVHANEGSGPGPILGAQEMELVQEASGPAVTINFPAQVSKEISPEQTAEFAVNVTNNRSEPVEITINRVNTLPTSWTSEVCTGTTDCDDANLVNYTIPANGTHTFTLKVHGMTASQSGTVRLVFTAGSIEEDQTFTVTTGVSGVAVAGEAGGLSMTEITPNPASNIARVDVTIPTGAQTVLEVYSITGQKVATLFQGRLEAGNRQIDANVSSLESGKYVLVLTSGDRKVSRTLTIVR